jgi:hypothetical protein
VVVSSGLTVLDIEKVLKLETVDISEESRENDPNCLALKYHCSKSTFKETTTNDVNHVILDTHKTEAVFLVSFPASHELQGLTIQKLVPS